MLLLRPPALGIGGHILLHFQIIEQVEVCIQLVVPIQCLQVAYGRAWLDWLRFDARNLIVPTGTVSSATGKEHSHGDSHE
jgi:hypothetical protein